MAENRQLTWTRRDYAPGLAMETAPEGRGRWHRRYFLGVLSDEHYDRNDPARFPVAHLIDVLSSIFSN